MSRFHERTLRLLVNEGARQKRSVESLDAWAIKNAIQIPASFLEWAELDGGDLLRRYSNRDEFWFDNPEVVLTPEGVRGLLFNQENQGNFDRIICLDHGDDPPVLFGWGGCPPWVKNAERFSDVVYAQVFDWQYQVEFTEDDPEYYGQLSFEADECLGVLRRRFEETVTTWFIVDDSRYTEYRFLKSHRLRMTVLVAEDRSTNIMVTGRPMEMVKALEAELKTMLGEPAL